MPVVILIPVHVRDVEARPMSVNSDVKLWHHPIWVGKDAYTVGAIVSTVKPLVILTPLEKVSKTFEMAISQATIPYSWYKITSNYANNSFSFQWPTGVYTAFTIPDGFYTVSDLNAYIQQVCITNGWYLIDGTGSNVYYVNLSINAN